MPLEVKNISGGIFLLIVFFRGISYDRRRTDSSEFFTKRPGKPLLYDLPEHDGGHEDGGGLSWGRASGKTGAGAGRDHGWLRPGLDGGAFLAGRDGKLAVLNGVTYEAVYEN